MMRWTSQPLWTLSLGKRFLQRPMTNGLCDRNAQLSERFDILPALKDEDYRDLTSLRYLLQRHCPRGYLAWFSHVCSPVRGFYGGEPTPYPRRSHIVSTGVTSGVPPP